SPKFQDRFVIVPVEESVNVTASGATPFTGTPLKPAVGGAACEQQMAAVIVTVSTYHPPAETLVSEPQRQRNWTDCPAAAAGRFTTVVIKPPELALHACLPPSGFPNELLSVRL